MVRAGEQGARTVVCYRSQANGRGRIACFRSEAGAVNITTRRPVRRLEGFVRAEGGAEGQYLGEAAVGGPLSETLGARVAVRSAGADSTVINRQDGQPLLRGREVGARGSLLWQPAAGTSVLMVSERQHQKDKVGLSVMHPFGEPPTVDSTPGLQYADNREDRHAIEANHDLASSRLTALVSHTPSRSDSFSCYDRDLANAVFGAPMEVCQRVHTEARTTNLDLRWSSAPGQPVFWVTGINASDADRRYDNQIDMQDTDSRRRYATRSSALYGEATYPILPGLKATAGLRYAQERKSYSMGE
jgi:iron complex outermembrane receptor protein